MCIHGLHLCLITTTDGSVTDVSCCVCVMARAPFFPTATANMHLPLARVACTHLFVVAHPTACHSHDVCSFVSVVIQDTVPFDTILAKCYF